MFYCFKEIVQPLEISVNKMFVKLFFNSEIFICQNVYGGHLCLGGKCIAMEKFPKVLHVYHVLDRRYTSLEATVKPMVIAMM